MARPGSRQGRGGKKLQKPNRGPRWPSSLLKELGVSTKKHGKKEVLDEEEADGTREDVYEYEGGVAEEERGKNKRYDSVDQLEYELPADFEDEEIDEDAATGEHSEDGGDEDSGTQDDKNPTLSSDVDTEDEDDELEEEEERAEKDEVDGSDDERHERMLKEVTGKADRSSRGSGGKLRRKPVMSEVYPESEFNLNPSSMSANGDSGRQITVEDLMATLHDTAGFGTLRKRMQQLQRGVPLEAPLPRVLQERVDRRAGYEKTQDDITKWQPLVKRNREAATLVLNKREPVPSISTAALADKFTPTTALEKEIDALLHESKVANVVDVNAAEALELNKLTVDEVRERQERLAKMRNLLFRHELKAKRVKKIKSKTFHRLLQKGQKSKAELHAAVAVADPEAAKEAKIKQEFKRAQERMTLKHKNSSRWAKRILKRGLKAQEGDGTRDAIAEQLRMHSALTRKIHSATLSDSSDGSESDEGEGTWLGGHGHSGLVLGDKSRSKLAKAKVATLKALEEDEGAELPKSGLFALPFMARAIEKKKKEAQNEALAILAQLEQAENDASVLSDDTHFVHVEDTLVDNNPQSGILSFRGSNKPPTRTKRSSPDSDEGDDGDCDATANNGAEFAGGVGRSLSASGKRGIFALVPERKETAQRKQDTILERKDMNQVGENNLFGVSEQVHMDGLAHRETHSLVKGTSSDQANLSFKNDIMSNGTITIQVDKPVPQFIEDDEDEEQELEAQGSLHTDGFLSQQDLIRQAFAGDDVEAEFEKAKAQTLDEEAPQGEAPVNLPGWGQWTHIQKKVGPPSWLIQEQEDIKRKRDIALSKRKDANLKYVIISEKMDKKAAKFSVPSVPFPYTSRELFEGTLRMPIGRDFNTDQTFKDMIRPAIIKSAGQIIDPIKLEKSPAQSKEVDAVRHVTKWKREQQGRSGRKNKLERTRPGVLGKKLKSG